MKGNALIGLPLAQQNEESWSMPGILVRNENRFATISSMTLSKRRVHEQCISFCGRFGAQWLDRLAAYCAPKWAEFIVFVFTESVGICLGATIRAGSILDCFPRGAHSALSSQNGAFVSMRIEQIKLNIQTDNSELANFTTLFGYLGPRPGYNFDPLNAANFWNRRVTSQGDILYDSR